MRQLEMMLGEQPFRDGLREYLKRYAFGNATWLDLVRILDAQTPENVAAWSRAWVEERGRPAFATSVDVDSGGRISSLRLTMTDPLHPGPDVAAASCVSRSGMPTAVRTLPVTIDGRVTTVTGAAGMERPLYVLPNGGGHRLWVVRAGRRQPDLPAWTYRRDSGRADTRQCLGHVVGQPAGIPSAAWCVHRFRAASLAA